MKAVIKFWNPETVLDTITSQDRIQPTAVYVMKMSQLVITYPTFVHMKVIRDGEN